MGKILKGKDGKLYVRVETGIGPQSACKNCVFHKATCAFVRAHDIDAHIDDLLCYKGVIFKEITGGI